MGINYLTKNLNCADSYFLNIHFNIILPSAPRFSKCLFPLRFPTKTLHAFLLPPTLHKPARMHLPNDIWWRILRMKFLTIHFF